MGGNVEGLPGPPIRLVYRRIESDSDVRAALQQAIEIELSTLPPYLYAAFTIKDGTNQAARRRINSIIQDEMVHLALACNVLNAIGGAPVLAHESVVPTYPGPLPYDIGADLGQPFCVSLLAFSPAAMAQAMRIETPEDPEVFPDLPDEASLGPRYETIGQFYLALETALGKLDPDTWSEVPRHQLTDHPFFAGRLFPVTGSDTAAEAIRRIRSEGEGTPKGADPFECPLDFEGEVSHYRRFEEILRNQVLERDPGAPEGFRWGEERLGVDWSAVFPAIDDPACHDFSGDVPARAAQRECDRSFTALLRELHRAVNGEPGRLGNAVAAMFDLRRSARSALATPLADSDLSAGPAFRFRDDL